MQTQTTAPEPSGIELTRKGESYLHEHANRDYALAVDRIRREAAAEIDRLMTLLDDLGGDPDLEDGGDDEPSADPEPSLGWTTSGHQGERDYHGGIDLELDEADREPSLGSSDAPWPYNQGLWADGRRDDAELDDSDYEPDEDGEESLGWTMSVEQIGYEFHQPPVQCGFIDAEADINNEREFDPADPPEGIGLDPEGW